MFARALEMTTSSFSRCVPPIGPAPQPGSWEAALGTAREAYAAVQEGAAPRLALYFLLGTVFGLGPPKRT